MPVQIDCFDLGLLDYKEAWDFQKEKFNLLTLQKPQKGQRNKSVRSCIILCTHPHVYTLGKSGKKENVLLAEDELDNLDIDFYKNDRGGDVTYHGPGQLVVYPILDLELFKTDITWYVRNLEEVVIQLLNDYGIKTKRIEGASGVWLDTKDNTGERKICALGVKTSRWITMHGIALNINTDLSYFNNIIPCGLQDKGVTSMEAQLNSKLEFNTVKSDFIHKFEEVFDVQCLKNSVPC